ncbi:MAG: hypothetical protein E7311_01155 [Clostridiales bacterium]|nr:hypothetical protein [Clostridiales bacterium]
MAKKKPKSNIRWIITVFLVTFILSTTFSYLSVEITENMNLVTAIILLFFIIGFGVIMDLVGISATTADINALHAKASDKKKGAKSAIKLVKNASKVASICADVIGDVCGILSGSVGVLVAMEISRIYNIELSVVTLIVGGIVAACTVTGKAILKQFGINNANEIVCFVGKILEFYKK